MFILIILYIQFLFVVLILSFERYKVYTLVSVNTVTLLTTSVLKLKYNFRYAMYLHILTFYILSSIIMTNSYSQFFKYV